MSKRKSWISLLVLIALSLFPCSSWAWSGKVVGVIDGDTIKILNKGEEVKVRLYGIDCPERGQAFGKKAEQFTTDMVFGKVVEVGAITIDHYGQTIALVYEGTKCLNEELIRAGLAWVYYLYCNFPICGVWKEIDDEVREARIGLWIDQEPTPPWEFRRKKRK